MSKKTSFVAAIDHFFHQRKDTFQIIGRYGLFWICVLCFVGIAGWIFGVLAPTILDTIRSVIMGEDDIWSNIPWLFMLLIITSIIGVPVVILFRLFRRYAKGDVFSMQNKDLLAALGTFQIICSGSPVLGILLLAVAVLVPSRDVDTPKADA